MKGVIFAELIRWIEQTYSPAMADAVITRSAVASNGAYTSVGTYPHQEALALIGQLAELSGEPVPVLADAYGYWLAARFVELYPEMFEGYTDVVSFLKDVDQHHHREVRKLYPDARTPSVVAIIDGQELVVSYASHRPFADVAYGLIRGYIAHFNDNIEVERMTAEGTPHAARFRLVADRTQVPLH